MMIRMNGRGHSFSSTAAALTTEKSLARALQFGLYRKVSSRISSALHSGGSEDPEDEEQNEKLSDKLRELRGNLVEQRKRLEFNRQEYVNEFGKALKNYARNEVEFVRAIIDGCTCIAQKDEKKTHGEDDVPAAEK